MQTPNRHLWLYGSDPMVPRVSRNGVSADFAFLEPHGTRLRVDRIDSRCVPKMDTGELNVRPVIYVQCAHRTVVFSHSPLAEGVLYKLENVH